MSDKTYVAGDYVTIYDFFMWEMLFRAVRAEEKVLENRPNLKKYWDTFTNIKQIKEYLAGDRYLKGPMNGPSATFNPKE